MSNVRFIADLHFHHKNMAIKRGFKDVHQHDEYIVQKWNSVVNKRDTTYILGDVTMETRDYSILDRLNGNKIVILGNHDMPNHVRDMLNHVIKVAGMVKYSRKGYPKMFLTHCPIHPREMDYRIGINIHGHIHEHVVERIGYNEDSDEIIIPDDRYICVSCEQVDYTPKLIEELLTPKYK